MDGHFEVERKRICLQFQLTDVYEYRSIFEDNTLYIEFVPPREVYEKIVVIDPAYGREDTGAVTESVASKDITLNVAKALKDGHRNWIRRISRFTIPGWMTAIRRRNAVSGWRKLPERIC